MQSRAPRRRVVNFTAHEKILLTQLLKKYPIVLAKLTDGKTVVRKKSAWDMLTMEFNNNDHVHKRDTQTLKRAWDNMKSATRKSKAVQPANETDILPENLLDCDVDDEFDPDDAKPLVRANDEDARDGSCLQQESSTDKEDSFFAFSDVVADNTNDNSLSSVGSNADPNDNPDEKSFTQHFPIPCGSQVYSYDTSGHQDQNVEAEQKGERSRKTSDYIRREAALRIKFLQAKETIHMQTLKVKLETEESKKRAADIEQRTNQILFEKAKLELEELKNRYMRN